MPLINKKKPGLLSRMFNSDKPQPSTLPSMGEKSIDDDGELLPAAEQGAPSRGLFASRRSDRAHATAADLVDVTDIDTENSPGSDELAEPTPAPSKPASAARTSIEGLFKSRQAKPAPVRAEPALDVPESDIADVTESTQVENTEAPAKPAAASKLQSLFGSKKPKAAVKSGSEKASTVATPTKAKKQPKASKKEKGGAAATSMVLLTDLGESGKQLLWSMTETTLAQVLVSPAPDEVISFSKEDIRFHTEGAMSYSKAQDMAIEEVGEIVAVVNRTKDLSAVYCTREERATSSPYRVGAGQQALDLLLKKTGREGQSLVTGFSLKDASGLSSVVVLYYVSQDGESSKPQVTVNPDNMEFVLSQFSSSRKINRKETEVVLFTNADLLSVAADIKFFADEKVWNGIPVRVLQNAGAGLTGLIAAGAVTWVGLGYLQKQSLVAQAAKVQIKAKALTEKNNARIETSLVSFAANLSQDQARMFSQAQQVWVPTAKVTAEMKSEETKITVVLPLVLGGTFNNGPSVNSVADAANVQRLYEKEAPEGCSKSQPQTTGNLNEIRIDIVCQSPDSTFHRYRGD